jgi:hypothetical protein
MGGGNIYGQPGFTVSNEDRLALASLLIKFGYNVKITKEKDANGKTVISVRYSL